MNCHQLGQRWTCLDDCLNEASLSAAEREVRNGPERSK
jgi:hypothetical protein